MKKSIKIKPIDTAYRSVKQILEEARKKAYSAVNFAREKRDRYIISWV